MHQNPGRFTALLDSSIVRRILLPALLAIASASCATSLHSEEPADLVAPGKPISELLELGWEISPAVTTAEAERRDGLADSEDWALFKNSIRPGDTLRPVSHNAGMGYAIFRNGVLADMLLAIVF